MVFGAVGVVGYGVDAIGLAFGDCKGGGAGGEEGEASEEVHGY